nr:MAG TPA_asm: hypothetical protein [Caudoviricetes sp.]DAQ66363.1 MAG TPA: hypothetical protein [Caudoviricetes sp.]
MPSSVRLVFGCLAINSCDMSGIFLIIIFGK